MSLWRWWIRPQSGSTTDERVVRITRHQDSLVALPTGANRLKASSGRASWALWDKNWDGSTRHYADQAGRTQNSASVPNHATGTENGTAYRSVTFCPTGNDVGNVDLEPSSEAVAATTAYLRIAARRRRESRFCPHPCSIPPGQATPELKRETRNMLRDTDVLACLDIRPCWGAGLVRLVLVVVFYVVLVGLISMGHPAAVAFEVAALGGAIGIGLGAWLGHRALPQRFHGR